MNFSVDVSHPLEWTSSAWADADTQVFPSADEEYLSSASIQNTSKILEQPWPSDEYPEPNLHDQDTDYLDSLMEVDEQIGDNFLGDELFGSSFSALNVVDDLGEEDRRFLAPLIEDTTTTAMDYEAGYVVTDARCPSPSSPSPIMHQKCYQEIMQKLEVSMQRSQATRRSLIMKTPTTKEYQRSGTVTGVLSSIETSSRQIQTLLHAVQQMRRSTTM